MENLENDFKMQLYNKESQIIELYTIKIRFIKWYK